MLLPRISFELLALAAATTLGVACASSNQPEPAHAESHQPAHAESHQPGHAESHGHGHGDGHGPAPLGHRFEHAADYRGFDDEKRAAWQKPEEVIQLMAITPGMTVADVGAGTGYFEPYLSRAVGPNGRVLALDIEPDMVRHLEQRAADEELANVEARQVAVDDPGLAEASVDRILIVDTWHHIPSREAYATQLARALRPGGEVVIVDFTADSPGGPPTHERLAPATVIGELAAAGLDATTVSETLPRQYVVVGRRK